MASARALAVASVVLPSILLHGCGGGGDDDKGDDDKDDDNAVSKDEQFIVDAFGGDPTFLWGAATAAAQIEGAWNKAGKQASIWDDFCHNVTHRDNSDGQDFKKQCGKIPAGAMEPEKWITLEVADDFYNQYKGDLSMLKGYGMNSLRVSLSWPRIMPLNKVTMKHEPNPEGIAFYTNVFKEMKKQGITPFVTLFHWDLPNDLSWLESDVSDAFLEYAELAFKSFPEVKDWATFNEPNSICSLGYAIGAFAPGHRETTGHIKCAHNILKAHAKTVKSFRKMDMGQIGIVLDYKWAYPLDPNNEKDVLAAKHDEANVLGQWAEPIFGSGDYPKLLKDFFGNKMPKFTEEEKKDLKGSADFFGLNTYGGKLAEWKRGDKPLENWTDGNDIAERYTFSPCNAGEDTSDLVDAKFECGAASGWLWAKPDAMRKYLNHVKTHYKVENVYVTEFGVDVDGESDMTKEDALKDTYRQEYYRRYMKQVALAKKEDDVNVKGVFAWSLMDNFEWGDGLNFRFGITYVDFNDLSRTAKGSAGWWKAMIAKMNNNSATITV